MLVSNGRWKKLFIQRHGKEPFYHAIPGAETMLALAELPDTNREIYTLFQIAGRTIKEIAQITGTTKNNIKVRIHRAKEKLTVLLKDLQEKNIRTE